ncbi:MAG: hypothetical protein RLZZ622_1149, partial [Planctomycetota bacterium]
LVNGGGKAARAEAVATSQITAAAAQIPSVTRRSTNSVQIQVFTTAMSRQTAKATAKIRPARLPRSHTQGSPGQSSVRER